VISSADDKAVIATLQVKRLTHRQIDEPRRNPYAQLRIDE
jgi:hypothetical protein